ncbi:hypothetical protein THAOC_21921, partial [Thalassiosira oceanica]
MENEVLKSLMARLSAIDNAGGQDSPVYLGAARSENGSVSAHNLGVGDQRGGSDGSLLSESPRGGVQFNINPNVAN